MKNLWFKNKKYGWGWTPATLNGWLVIAAYCCVVIGYPLLAELGYYSLSLPVLFSVVAISTVSLTAVCYWKGESPAWNWGGK